ncbi:MAG: hypothetical protein JY451_11675 [Erythrobacter sp.]|nr:MAG: hypothetical protein JY451_11675 [Erythrobacter sp.]
MRARARATSYVTAPVEPLPDSDPLLGFAPVPHVAPRRNSITPDRQRAFIAHLAATGIVKQAALHIGASLEALYKLRQRPGAEGFCSAWDRAVDYGVQRLEDCALARAIEGEERLVVSSGQLIGTERRHNEALVMFFLRHRRAERYAAEIRPGHPLYERVRAELLVELEREFALRAEEDEEEVLASLTAKLEDMRNRQIAADALRAELGLGPEEDEA